MRRPERERPKEHRAIELRIREHGEQAVRHPGRSIRHVGGDEDRAGDDQQGIRCGVPLCLGNQDRDGEQRQREVRRAGDRREDQAEQHDRREHQLRGVRPARRQRRRDQQPAADHQGQGRRQRRRGHHGRANRRAALAEQVVKKAEDGLVGGDREQRISRQLESLMDVSRPCRRTDPRPHDDGCHRRHTGAPRDRPPSLLDREQGPDQQAGGLGYQQEAKRNSDGKVAAAAIALKHHGQQRQPHGIKLSVLEGGGERLKDEHERDK
jgi:hypothetical protein